MLDSGLPSPWGVSALAPSQSVDRTAQMIADRSAAGSHYLYAHFKGGDAEVLGLSRQQSELGRPWIRI